MLSTSSAGQQALRITTPGHASRFPCNAYGVARPDGGSGSSDRSCDPTQRGKQGLHGFNQAMVPSRPRFQSGSDQAMLSLSDTCIKIGHVALEAGQRKNRVRVVSTRSCSRCLTHALKSVMRPYREGQTCLEDFNQVERCDTTGHLDISAEK